MEACGPETLDEILSRFVNSLINVPINNDRYIATFHPESRSSGKVIFWDKKSDKSAEAQWRAYKQGMTIMAVLSYNGFLLFDENYQDYKEKVSRRLLVF